MLDQLIKFAEELYKKDKEMGIRLGKIIQDIGAHIVKQNMLTKEMNDKIRKLENKLKKRKRNENHCLDIYRGEACYDHYKRRKRWESNC